MEITEKAKKLVMTLVFGVVLVLLLVLLRPMFVGQVTAAGAAYNITTATGQTTVTPTGTMTTVQSDSIYSLVIYIIALLVLIALILEGLNIL